MLLEAELGVGVEVAAPRRHVLMELADPVDDRHGVLLRAAARLPVEAGSRCRGATPPAARRQDDGICVQTKMAADG